MRAGVIIIKNKQILLMKRFHNAQHYYALPGGGVEDNELPCEAAIREAREETSLKVVLVKKFISFVDHRDNRIHLYFFVKSFTGKLKLGGIEALKNSPANHYELVWMDVKNISKLKLYPLKIKKDILKKC